MHNIPETSLPVKEGQPKAAIPGVLLKEMTPAQQAEDINIRMPRGIAAFLAEDLEKMGELAMKPGAPPSAALRSLGWVVASMLVKEAIAASLHNPKGN